MTEQLATGPVVDPIQQQVTPDQIRDAVASLYPNLLENLREDFVRMFASTQAEQQPKIPRQSWTQSETLVEWYKAMADAQKDVEHAEKDGENTYARYKYATAEEVIHTAKEALAQHGMGLFRLTYGYTAPTQIDHHAHGLRDVYRAVTRWRVFHTSGEWVEIDTVWPFMEEKGRPIDKAYAAALTESLAYFLRDLVQIPRGAGEKIEGDVAGRNDNDYDPRDRAQGQGGGRGQDNRGGYSRDDRSQGQGDRQQGRPQNQAGGRAEQTGDQRGQSRGRENDRAQPQGGERPQGNDGQKGRQGSAARDDRSQGQGDRQQNDQRTDSDSSSSTAQGIDAGQGEQSQGGEKEQAGASGQHEDVPTVEQFLTALNSEKGLELAEGQELAAKMGRVNQVHGETAALALLNNKFERLKKMDPKTVTYKSGDTKYSMVQAAADALVKNGVISQQKGSSFFTALGAGKKDWAFQHGKAR